jgi:hypothetical protein
MSEFLEPGHVRGDIKLAATARIRGFNTSDNIRNLITKKLAALATDKDISPEIQLKACSELRKCVEHDDAIAAASEPQQHQHIHAVIPTQPLSSLDEQRAEVDRLIALIR